MAKSNSTALSVQTKEFRAGKINRFETEATVTCDPLTNWIRIEIQKCSRGGIVNNPESENTRTPRCVEAKDRIAGDANPIVRHDAKHHGTGGRSCSIDDNLLAGISQRHVARPIGANVASPVVCYAHNCSGGSRRSYAIRIAASQNVAQRDFANKKNIPRFGAGTLMPFEGDTAFRGLRDLRGRGSCWWTFSLPRRWRNPEQQLRLRLRHRRPSCWNYRPHWIPKRTATTERLSRPLPAGR